MDSKMLGKFSKRVENGMNTLSEAFDLIDALVASMPAREPFKVYGPRLARRLGVTVRRVRALIHREVRSIDAAEMDRLRAMAQLPVARPVSAPFPLPELAHADRYDAIAAMLETVDGDLHRADIAHFRGLARQFRGVDRAMRSVADHRAVAR